MTTSSDTTPPQPATPAAPPASDPSDPTSLNPWIEEEGQEFYDGTSTIQPLSAAQVKAMRDGSTARQPASPSLTDGSPTSSAPTTTSKTPTQ
jgi:hypothetical protein